MGYRCNADDYWHCGEGTLVKSVKADEGCLQSPATAISMKEQTVI